MKEIIRYPRVQKYIDKAAKEVKFEEMNISTGVRSEMEIQHSSKSIDGQEETDPLIDEHDSTELDSNSHVEADVHAVQDESENYEEIDIQTQNFETIDIYPPSLIPEIQHATRSKQSPLEKKPMPMVCRLCAISSDNVTDIFGPTAFHKIVAEQIRKCLPITVKESDTLPTAACHSCLEKLEACYQFNMAVIRAETKLRFYHKQVPHELDEDREIRRQTTSRSDKHIAMQNAFDGIELDHSTEPFVESSRLGGTSAYQSELNFREELESNETVINLVNHLARNTKRQSGRQIRTHQSPSDGSSYSLRKRKPVNYNMEDDRGANCKEEGQVPALLRRGKIPALVSHYDKFNRDLDSETTLKPHFLLVHNQRELSPREMCETQLGTGEEEEEVDYDQDKRELQRILCEQEFRSDNAFPRHSEISSDDKQFACDLCGKLFNRELNLSRHLEYHVRERPFSCDFCPKTFIYKSVRDNHHRSHTKERPFECDFCPKKFSLKTNRDKHCRLCRYQTDAERSHSYIPEFCEKKFQPKQNANKRRRVNKGERLYSCGFCPKIFNRKYNRDQHQRIHTDERPYGCDYCEKTFRTASNWKYHLRQHQQNI